MRCSGADPAGMGGGMDGGSGQATGGPDANSKGGNKDDDNDENDDADDQRFSLSKMSDNDLASWKVDVRSNGSKSEKSAKERSVTSSSGGRTICTMFQVAKLAEQNYHLTQDAISIGRATIESVHIDDKEDGSRKRSSSSRKKRAEKLSMSTQTAGDETAEAMVCACLGGAAQSRDEKEHDEEKRKGQMER